ncbi:MAG: hypothetical protein GTN35_02410 [Nitrososphaeria archaeon]|nr:hypothetical protein [Nitrosopumilaceae archaeon]NIP09698.1 hypothetical protein [Nitrosopumilaceae archaeon]NIP91245.1 hypothetical protein [Nitrososphaeria archaeon]NIS95757.1 hypothetical protein [Nitrosopumilaceae archaeon]
MTEYDEFAEALIDQLAVEINEEKDNSHLASKIDEDSDFNINFDSLEQASERLFPWAKQKIQEFSGLLVPENTTIKFPELVDLKKLKGKRIYTTDDARDYVDYLVEAISNEDLGKISSLMKQDPVKFLVYSTYAKNYISKISVTFGDYLDNTIYLNKLFFSILPKIKLYNQGPPFENNFELINSSYMGGIKMTLLEESIHAIQQKLYEANKEAVKKVNEVYEDLAKIVLEIDDSTLSTVCDYMNLEPVPDDFPIAKRANLYFVLNPENFILGTLPPDQMATKEGQIDTKLSEMIPQLSEIYHRWLKPRQDQYAAMTVIQGMANVVIKNILKDDSDFKNYLSVFKGTDLVSFQAQKNLGIGFAESVFEKLGKDVFKKLIDDPPNTLELKDPQLYLSRIQSQ